MITSRSIDHDEFILREFICRVLLHEAGWEDPDVVSDDEYDERDDDKFDDLERERPARKIARQASTNYALMKRDNYAHANTSMISFKPIAPKNAGGPQSGRTPVGGGLSTTLRSYNSTF